MSHRITLVSAAVFVLAGAGCVDWTETMELNADGSGTLVMTLTVPKAGLGPRLARVDALPTEASIKAGLPEGVTCETFDRTTKAKTWKNPANGKEQKIEFETFTVKLAFTDAERLNRVRLIPEPKATGSGGAMMKSEERRPGPFRELTVKLDEETLTFRRVIQKARPMKMRSGGTPKGQAAANLLNHEIRLTLRCPGDVISSNATEKDGRTLTWVFPLSKLMKQQHRDHTVEFTCKRKG